jgi:hypothetical protein
MSPGYLVFFLAGKRCPGISRSGYLVRDRYNSVQYNSYVDVNYLACACSAYICNMYFIRNLKFWKDIALNVRGDCLRWKFWLILDSSPRFDKKQEVTSKQQAPSAYIHICISWRFRSAVERLEFGLGLREYSCWYLGRILNSQSYPNHTYRIVISHNPR